VCHIEIDLFHPVRGGPRQGRVGTLLEAPAWIDRLTLDNFLILPTVGEKQ
jgi:hypothetical protein